jgi:hypothetical protein
MHLELDPRPVPNAALDVAVLCVDQILFWNHGDLERKLDSYKVYYNRHRCLTGLAGITPAQRSGDAAHPIANLASYRWRKHCNGLFQTPA